MPLWSIALRWMQLISKKTQGWLGHTCLEWCRCYNLVRSKMPLYQASSSLARVKYDPRTLLITAKCVHKPDLNNLYWALPVFADDTNAAVIKMHFDFFIYIWGWTKHMSWIWSPSFRKIPKFPTKIFYKSENIGENVKAQFVSISWLKWQFEFSGLSK